MTTWLVSRHPGAMAWVGQQGQRVDQQVRQLDLAGIAQGDTVIGALPVRLAAEVCQRGARLIRLNLNVPEHWRGMALSCEQMQACGANLEPHIIDPAAVPALPEALHAWPRCSVHFQAHSQGMKAARHFGSAWHGGIGLWLHQHHPQAYLALYGGAANAVKPYLLIPPFTAVQGQVFTLKIRLFAAAIAHQQAVMDAVAALSQSGVGPERGRFSLLSANAHRLSWDCSEGPTQAMLQLQTPTLLKVDNHFLRTVPSLATVMQRTLGRLVHLGCPLTPEVRAGVLATAAQATVQNSALQWQSSPRYSARQHAWMPFGGLVGNIHYQNLAPALWPWLRLITCLHLGNKTTFGHGQAAFLPI